MNKERKLPWFELRDLPYCMVLPLLAVIALVVPQHLWQRLCNRLVGLFILGTPAIRRGLLARIKEALGPSQIGIRPEVICAGYVVNKLLVQLEYYRALSPWGWSCETKLFGREHVDKALRAGKGVILWVTPANSSDLVVKRCLAENGLSFSHLSARTHGYSESRFGFVALNGPNRYVENKYLAHRIVLDRARPIRAIRELQRRISRNEIVSITAIENTGGDSFEVRCFNCLLPIGVGPVWSAFSTGATLLPVFCTRTERGSYLVEIKSAIEIRIDQPRQAAFAAAFEEFGRLVEEYARSVPDQWYGWTHLKSTTAAGVPARSRWNWINKMPKPVSSRN